MARVPLRNPDDENLDEATRKKLLELRARFGSDNNFFLLMANSLDALDAMQSLSAGAYFGRHVDPRTTELAYLTASVTNRCHY
jgi:alkylhydroperoxidase family enzyme